MKNLGALFSRFKGKSKRGFFGFGNSPEADWKVIFISAAVLILLVTALNVYFFVEIDKAEIFAEGSGAEGKMVLDVSVLKETVSYYQNKALEFERIINATSTSAVDPSL